LRSDLAPHKVGIMGIRLRARTGAAGFLSALVLLAVSPTPASATFPGADGKIFYTSDAGGHLDIWSMDPGGANQTNLTDSTVWDERPAVSPDGQTVAYASHVNPNDVGIYLMSSDGSSKRPLIDDPEVLETDPAFTPDGDNVLFTGSSTGTKPEIYTVPLAGGSPVDLTDNSEEDREPDACATDGKVAFVSSRTGDNDIYVMESNGMNQTDLTQVSGSQEIEPSWSPDCSHIAYISSQDAGNFEVYVMDSNGANQTRITSTSAFEREPTWSPDGSLIAYASGSDVVTQAPTAGAPTTPIAVGPVGAELAQPSWASIPSSGPGGGGGTGGGGGPGGAGIAGGSGGGGGNATSRPQTKISAVHVHGRTAIVIFSGALPGAGQPPISTSGLSFKCKLDRGKFKPCTSPKEYRRLNPGRHKVQIEATDRSGITDPTPAKKVFKIR
jgi:dipeptidyl aminopeptidase/acylaminoacyl peptidase